MYLIKSLQNRAQKNAVIGVLFVILSVISVSTRLHECFEDVHNIISTIGMLLYSTGIVYPLLFQRFDHPFKHRNFCSQWGFVLYHCDCCCRCFCCIFPHFSFFSSSSCSFFAFPTYKSSSLCDKRHNIMLFDLTNFELNLCGSVVTTAKDDPSIYLKPGKMPSFFVCCEHE